VGGQNSEFSKIKFAATNTQIFQRKGRNGSGSLRVVFTIYRSRAEQGEG